MVEEYITSGQHYKVYARTGVFHEPVWQKVEPELKPKPHRKSYQMPSQPIEQLNKQYA